MLLGDSPAERRRQGNGSPFVYPHKRDPTKPLNSKSFYRHIFKPACDRAGITLSRENGKTWHTLRHTFAGRLQAKGVPLGDIQRAGRWKSAKAMERYLKYDQGRVLAAVCLIATDSKQTLIELSKAGNSA